MKNLFLLIILFTISIFPVFSQVEYYDCATADDTTSDAPGVYSYSTDSTIYENAEPVVLNIFFWQVKDQNGDYGNAVFSEDKLLESVALLNIEYNPYNIFFKYRGNDSFSTPADLPLVNRVWDEELQKWVCQYVSGEFDPNGYGVIGRCQISSFFSYASNNGYERNDALNIYVPYGSEFGGAAKSHGSNMTVLKISKLNQTTALHEIAHNLGIKHTRYPYPPEHTTRVEFLANGDPNPDFNAKTAGDLVVDTNANSGYLFFDADGNLIYPFIDEVTCEYNGLEEDELGVPYTITHEDVINTMSNAYTCVENYFTPGQIVRMHETIVNDSDLIPTITEVSSLFEPYSGTYYNAGPVLPEHKPLFQPGFEYRFVECNGNYPQPADFYDTFSYNINNVILSIDKYETDYRSILHPNHTAIMILHHDLVPVPYPRKCYDNWNRKPSGGSITKFNDNVLNTNITVTVKDSTAINNQNLIQNLENGLYKIEKNYEDGSSQETIIFKDNN